MRDIHRRGWSAKRQGNLPTSSLACARLRAHLGGIMKVKMVNGVAGADPNVASQSRLGYLPY